MIQVIAFRSGVGENRFFLEEEMGLARHNLDPKSRRLVAIGCACLAVGLALRIFVHPAALNQRIFLHVVVGTLLGFFIGLVLFGVQGFYACRVNRG